MHKYLEMRLTQVLLISETSMVYICNDYYKCTDREAYIVSIEIIVLTELHKEEEIN